MPDRKLPDLEIVQDLKFQRRAWTVERIGWILFALIVAAALAGFFGTGAVSTTAVRSADGRLAVEYPRFARQQSPNTIRVAVEPSPSGERTLRLWVDRAYLQGLGLAQIVPRPQRTEAGADRIVMEFALAAAGEPVTILLNVQPQKLWKVDGRIGVESGDHGGSGRAGSSRPGGGDAAAVEFWQFVYP
ncbi:MAG: hypothetical protein JXB36_12855 [Gammaproteobacteria bacterium]|nr:hypothetical protein [Gammaproteobacteria bacterium]